VKAGETSLQIGIISDTHGSLPLQVHEVFADVEHILHAGDIGGQSIIDELETIAPVTAVYGNCDYSGDYLFDRWAEVTLSDTHLFMTHTPKDLSDALDGLLPSGIRKPHIAIHGHTHIPREQRIGQTLYLCPGSPVRPRGGSASSVILLDLCDGMVTGVQIVNLLKGV
jgi:putative phosphoesterase